jgi:CubicO group peptidase (beta-lactamase class C family)
MRFTLQTLVMMILLAAAAVSQIPYEASVESFVKGELVRQKIPGVSIAVVSDGKPTLVKGFGLANVEHQVAATPDTIFQSGSVGKQFTAMAVMMLIEEGKAKLDDKINAHLTDVPTEWSGITIRHLLTHTAGLGDYPQDFNLQQDATEAEIFKKLQLPKPSAAPGERWAYSNVGYVTLGVLIRKLSGQFYGDFLKERVFKPLGMTTARVISEQDIVANRSGGYMLVKGELKNQTWVAPMLNTTADGALYLTAHDMVKWEAGLSSSKLLSKAGYDAMWAPVKLNNGSTHPYGFGWMFANVNGNQVIEHSGSWQGFKAHIVRYPDKKLAVIVFANLAQANPTSIAHGIAGIVDPTLKQPPMADPDPDHTAGMKKLFEQVLDGTADLNRFTDTIQAALKAQERMTSEIKGYGPIKQFTFVDKTEGAASTRFRYKIEWDAMSLSLIVVFDKQGKITGYGLQPA